MNESTDFDIPPTRMSIMELPGSDIQREGYLKKLKTNKKKYFVLRSTSSSGPSRLEYYDSEKKLKLGLPPKRSIKLHTCFNINKKFDAKQKHAITLHTKEDSFSIVADDAIEQELWLNLLLKLQNEYIPPGEMPKPHYDHVWQISVKPKGLGLSKALCGDYRLCLSESEVHMVRKNTEKPEFVFNINNIRRCGNTDNFFLLEVGRNSPTGPGEFYMQLEDKFIAQNVHEEMLLFMRKNSSGGDNFRQRSSTETKMRRSHDDESSDTNSLRHRTHSDGKKTGGSQRKLHLGQRPQSVSNLPSRSSVSVSDHNLSGFYANIPSTFTVPRDRSDSASSKASSHKSFSSEIFGSSPDPVYENTKDKNNKSTYRSLTPEVVSPITEESISYMQMSPSPALTSGMESMPYLEMSPGQQSSTQQTILDNQLRSPNMPISPGTPKTPVYDKSYMSMSPGQSIQESSTSSYMDMSPGQHSVPNSMSPGQRLVSMDMSHGQHSIAMTTSPVQQSVPILMSPQNQVSLPLASSTPDHLTPYSPPTQRAPKPDTPPSQRGSRPGSSCSHDSSITSTDGYMEMNPAECSKSSEKVDAMPNGYIDMAVGSSSSTSSKDGSPKLSRTAPIPIRATKQQSYLEMTPSSQPLPPVKEGGSGEGYLPMSPQSTHSSGSHYHHHHQHPPFNDSTLRPNKVVSYLSDDSMSGEFPKRAYSVGSRPQRKLIHHLHHLTANKPSMSDNGRSSSAPHLIEKKLRGMVPYTQMDSSLSCSPSQSIKSSISDSDSFVEMDYIRPRTASDSFGCRPRSSSFGKVFTQGHRPRSSSYGTSARGKLGSFESVRLTSKELNIKVSNESLNCQMSGASSAESLKKTDLRPHFKQISEYVDMKLDKSEAAGYVDMTVNPKSVGNKAASSVSSSPGIPEITSPSKPPDNSLSPSIKIIKPSGITQCTASFTSTSNSVLSAIPPQSSLFSPISFSPSGSRSPSVKGRSPASSGKESEEESYLPYQPSPSERQKDCKKTEHKKEKKSWHSKHSKNKDKHKDKHSEDPQKKMKDSDSDKSLESNSAKNVHQMRMDRDSMYMDFEPGALGIEMPSDSQISFSLGPDLSNSMSGSDISCDTSQNQKEGNESSYMEYQPDAVIPLDLKDKLVDESDNIGYMEYEPGSLAIDPTQTVENTPPIPPRKQEGIDIKTEAISSDEAGSSSIETVKGGSAEVDPYMEFNPEEQVPSEVKTPTRVRSFITDTSMEEEFAKEEIKSSVKQNVDIKNPEIIEKSPTEKTPNVQIKNKVNPVSTIPENDEYVGLDFTCKSSERLLLGGISPGVKTVGQEKLMDSKNSTVFDSKKEVRKMKIDTGDDKKNDFFKESSLSLEDRKVEKLPAEKDVKEAKCRHLSDSAKASLSPVALTKPSSLPCIDLPAEILENLQINEKTDTDTSSGSNSRQSCTDLTVSYEPMNFPSDTIKSSELSSSQQLLATPGLNYASLDLGPKENDDISEMKPQPVKSRHSSSADDTGPLPPNSYAQIDFKMSENLKNTSKQDGKFVLD